MLVIEDLNRQDVGRSADLEHQVTVETAKQGLLKRQETPHGWEPPRREGNEQPVDAIEAAIDQRGVEWGTWV